MTAKHMRCKFIRTSVQVGGAGGACPDRRLIAMLEWLSGDRGESVNWDVRVTDSVILHEVRLVKPAAFSETAGQALDTTTYYGMLKVCCSCVMDSQLQLLKSNRRIV